MSRNDRRIIVWGQERRRSPAPQRYEGGRLPGSPAPAPSRRRDRAAPRIMPHPELLRRVDRLIAENTRLRAEVLELRRANQDLEGSAEIWVTLFERQVARAQKLEAELKTKQS